ncbi:hypothetical protein D9M73_164770 [compost metagenome]
MLFEVGEAAAERMPPCIDDPRLRQNQVDEGDMRPVVGQFVDEEGAVGAALDAGALEILLAHLAQPLGGPARQPLGIGRIAPGECGDVGQFAGPLDLAVAGEDLLDQRRSGARHPEDEDRVGRGKALAGAFG